MNEIIEELGTMELTQEDLYYLEDLMNSIRNSVKRLERFIEIKRVGLEDTQQRFDNRRRFDKFLEENESDG